MTKIDEIVIDGQWFRRVIYPDGTGRIMTEEKYDELCYKFPHYTPIYVLRHFGKKYKGERE